MEKLNLHPQYIKDDTGVAFGVFLTVTEFESILEELEDLEDIKAVDAYQRGADKEAIPFRQAVEEIKVNFLKNNV